MPNGCRDVYCQYKLPYPTQTFTTPKKLGTSRDFEFKYLQRHNYDYTSETLLNFLLESSICVKVYGYTEGGIKLVQKQKAAESPKIEQKVQVAPKLEEKPPVKVEEQKKEEPKKDEQKKRRS